MELARASTSSVNCMSDVFRELTGACESVSVEI